ncbi:hypothetical protein SKAU_G00048230 [Synaphobranchus kaupii]|uniref:Uncharacterized protein n=1 Tax=Synaphobranchus kaupii TaxID=118154 RepID=A0A9Q1G2F4_SYNKA|nr:hypothetical protein SKAU_G00048230 [Synaphobranchus kaupii]
MLMASLHYKQSQAANHGPPVPWNMGTFPMTSPTRTRDETRKPYSAYGKIIHRQLRAYIPFGFWTAIFLSRSRCRRIGISPVKNALQTPGAARKQKNRARGDEQNGFGFFSQTGKEQSSAARMEIKARKTQSSDGETAAQVARFPKTNTDSQTLASKRRGRGSVRGLKLAPVNCSHGQVTPENSQSPGIQVISMPS